MPAAGSIANSANTGSIIASATVMPASTEFTV